MSGLTAEERENLAAVLGCFICGGATPDEHWSGCPFAPVGANADTDPDAGETLPAF